MIIDSNYQAAKLVASSIEKHFTDHLQRAQSLEELNLASVPENKMIEAIINTTFWASLRHEEGHSPKISLAFLPPEHAKLPVVFAHKLELNSDILTKLAPAVEPAGIHLGIWHEAGELYIWGTTRFIPSLCFVIEVIEPGLLVIKHRRIDGYGKFVNVAVLKGDQIKLVDEDSVNMPDCPALLTSLLGFTTPSTWNHSVNVLIELASAMRAHKRGGTLLLVPSSRFEWKESIIHPLSYPLVPSYNGLTKLLEITTDEKTKLLWHAELEEMVESIAGLTAIDGATVINDQYEVLAFGVKIGRSAHSEHVDQMLVTEPIKGSEAQFIHPASNGGTRHLSAAQFVYDQRDAIALVASQDGLFTIFAWSPCEGVVHAHRIDSLLL